MHPVSETHTGLQSGMLAHHQDRQVLLATFNGNIVGVYKIIWCTSDIVRRIKLSHDAVKLILGPAKTTLSHDMQETNDNDGRY